MKFLKLLSFALLFVFSLAHTAGAEPPCQWAFDAKGPLVQNHMKWFFNTSNPTKRAHLNPLITQAGIEFLSDDLDEIEADHLSVVVHKASQFRDADHRVIVEDTALFIEGAEVGENIRWQVSSLSSYIGRKATWVSLIAYRDGDVVRVFKSISEGQIVDRISGKEGIEAYFHSETIDGVANQLSTPPSFTALRHLLNNEVFAIMPCIETWEGRWQNQENKRAS